MNARPRFGAPATHALTLGVTSIVVVLTLVAPVVTSTFESAPPPFVLIPSTSGAHASASVQPAFIRWSAAPEPVPARSLPFLFLYTVFESILTAPECVVCGAETSVTAACPHCATPVCADHRAPAAHACAGVDADRTGGWVVDLDGPMSRAEADARVGTVDSWRDLLTPSRSGLRLARGTLLLLVVAVLVGGLAGPQAGEVVASAGLERVNETAVEREIAEEVNGERRKAGLDPLAYDATLASVAGAHSADMCEREFVGHTNPDGEGLGARYAAFGLTCPGGENVYYSANGALAASPGTLADHVVRAWMNSEGHRESLLRERFTRQGIGVAVDGGALYVTQEFC
jgi:uncharacterized protein YkwD